MQIKDDIKILATLGPSSLTKGVIEALGKLGVALLRVNLSHTPLKTLPGVLTTIRKHSKLPICLDTEGAQVRTGSLSPSEMIVAEGEVLSIAKTKKKRRGFHLYPEIVLEQLEPGNLMTIDFHSVVAQVIEVDRQNVTLRVLIGGKIGRNKAVTLHRSLSLPPFTEKDLMAIKTGLEFGVRHIALSFTHVGEDVRCLREIVGTPITVISKIECRQGVENLKAIAQESDALLIDRGDLSREVPIEKLALVQKQILKDWQTFQRPIYIATNLLESMVVSPFPTRSEVNDLYGILLDGADGLVLAAETAVGRYPVHVVEMIAKIIKEARSVIEKPRKAYCYFKASDSILHPPHGGTLISQPVDPGAMNSVSYDHTFVADPATLLDIEQIATGTYSPLTGFMNREQLESVLRECQIGRGSVWTMPVLFQADGIHAKQITKGDTILMKTDGGENHSLLKVEEIFSLDLPKIAQSWFGTDSERHPGVEAIMKKGSWALAGKVTLLRKQKHAWNRYQFSPAESRMLFSKMGWHTVVGFHTRNPCHRGHEAAQRYAMEKVCADGLYITPLTGPKKKGDFLNALILESYQRLIDADYYPGKKVLLGSFATYPRYAGPREAVFTALCRKNMGCTHFIIGRDHAGVGNFYGAKANEDLFDRLGNIGITPVFVPPFSYHLTKERYLPHEEGDADCVTISGSMLRKKVIQNKEWPRWLLRPEVEDLLKQAIANREPLFQT